MDIDPTQTVEKQTGKFVIACAIDPITKKPYPIVINPVTGELLVNAKFTGSIAVDLDGAGVTGDNVRLFFCCDVGAVTITGAGLDDLSVLGRYLGLTPIDLQIEIDLAGVPDTFKWSKDGGATWEATGIAITGAEQVLTEGLTILFAATTGHTLTDLWDCTVKPGYMINPRKEDGHGSKLADPTFTEITNPLMGYITAPSNWYRFSKENDATFPTTVVDEQLTSIGDNTKQNPASATLKRGFTIEADSGNAGSVRIAKNALVSATRGKELTAGEDFPFIIDDPAKLEIWFEKLNDKVQILGS